MRTGSGASERAFVDTIVLVYSLDERDPRRREIALSLVRGLTTRGEMVTSTQVASELCAVLARNWARAGGSPPPIWRA